jgi:hypothetical protein
LNRAGFDKNVTNVVDLLAAVLVFSHNAWTLYGTLLLSFFVCLVLNFKACIH